MQEGSKTIIPGAEKSAAPHQECWEDTTMDDIHRQAEAAARLQSTNTMTVDVNQYIRKTQEELQEEELKAAGWTPMTAHPRSPVWRSPEGVLVPGPGYAWLVMKERETAVTP
jgi:hypothetical protein